MANSFVDRIKDYIGCNSLLTDGAKVVVGLSGGADSTALLLVLIRLGYRVHAVHCNFHLRGAESDRDQEFVKDLCKRTSVELTVCDYDTREYASAHGISIEMAARELRYADFERIMQECGASAICIAHHRDDSVETLLLNLIRGTGIKGLTGIKPQNGHIIRPLLCVSRQQIEDWLHEIGQSYVTDSTNLETDYTRNKIRLQLMPLMRSINPDVNNAVNDTARHLQQAFSIYSKAIEDAKKRIVTVSADITSISIPELNRHATPAAVLFEILAPFGFNSTQVSDILAAVDSQPGTRFLSATHQLVKDRDSFTVSPVKTAQFQPLTIVLKPGTAVTLPNGTSLSISTAPAGTPISTSPNTATFDASLLGEGIITIREWTPGDWFIPFGMKGRKLISDFLTDCKTAPTERSNQLIASFNNDIIWVLGRRTDNRYRVTPKTTTQLILTLSAE
ncbi:MAG: tRNA lysidine(34) synthetase TilS [Bacteroidaceae bacterium]|nr:tRNA lysidine(34) synthetase TilS [Bacteroidaceae bacterium]